MYRVHRSLFTLKKDNLEHSANYALKILAADLAKSVDIICFDEFAITTIQDCTILTGLFAEIFRQGITVVTTSNREPKDLYEDGLNRYDHFHFIQILLRLVREGVARPCDELANIRDSVGTRTVLNIEKYESANYSDCLWVLDYSRYMYIPPFLKTLHRNMEVINVRSTDYRRDEFQREFRDSFNGSNDTSTSEKRRVEEDHSFAMQQKLFFSVSESSAQQTYLNEHGWAVLQTAVQVEIGYNRTMTCRLCSEDIRVARFHFKELFHGPPFFGADDYNALCKQFHTIILDGMRVLQVEDHNEAKRLTNFLDCAYENHTQLVCVNMEDSDAERIFGNLLPLQELNLEELLRQQKEEERKSGSASSTALHGTVGSGDQDQSASSSGVLEAVRQIKESVQNTQQSCYYLSADHKDWSVETRVVQTSTRPSTAGVATAGSGAREKQIEFNAQLRKTNIKTDNDIELWKQDEHGTQ